MRPPSRAGHVRGVGVEAEVVHRVAPHIRVPVVQVEELHGEVPEEWEQTIFIPQQFQRYAIFFRDFLDRQTLERSSSTNNSNKNSNKNNNNRTETAAAAATSTTKRSRFRERITKSNKRASYLPYESVVNDLEDGGDEDPGDGEAD